jgi:hypothetical protein
MTPGEKSLLIKDLCARLPYKVMVHIRYNTKEPCYGELTPKDIQWFIDSKIKEIKPYLRPMPSMTEEEKEEYINIKQGECNGCVLTGKGDPNTEFLLVDFFNAHHFDYRGLIEKGLAIEALEGMYK